MSVNRFNGSRPTRRSGAQIATIKAAIYDLLAAEQPCTVRQTFYRLVSAGVVGKTEGEYKSTVIRLLGDMRRNHEVPFHWIADNTRWMRKPDTFSSLERMLRYSADAYRRSVWDNQNCYDSAHASDRLRISGCSQPPRYRSRRSVPTNIYAHRGSTCRRRFSPTQAAMEEAPSMKAIADSSISKDVNRIRETDVTANDYPGQIVRVKPPSGVRVVPVM